MSLQKSETICLETKTSHLGSQIIMKLDTELKYLNKIVYR